MQKEYKSIRLFKHDWMEKFSHVHPLTPLVLWTPVIGFLLWRSLVVHHIAWYSLIGVMAGALVAWTLVEYLLHRFVFHFVGEFKVTQRLHYIIHGLHHDDPQDPTRLVMPPFPAIVLGLILYPAFRLLLGQVWVDPFFAFFLVGYLMYDYTHFAVHHFNPKSRIGKLIKQHHMMHHFVDTESRWGVSSPLWDYVFGTHSPHSSMTREAGEKKHQPTT